jgi:hypothetical protein
MKRLVSAICALLLAAALLLLGAVSASTAASTTRAIGANYHYDHLAAVASGVTTDKAPGTSPLGARRAEHQRRVQPVRFTAPTGVAAEDVPIGGDSYPRFVVTGDGTVIDTSSPSLTKQIERVADSILTTGAPPPGVRQGGYQGVVGLFANKGDPLPTQPLGYYTESDVWAGPGSRDTERIVVGAGGEVWYSPDHYGSFRPVR